MNQANQNIQTGVQASLRLPEKPDTPLQSAPMPVLQSAAIGSQFGLPAQYHPATVVPAPQPIMSVGPFTVQQPTPQPGRTLGDGHFGMAEQTLLPQVPLQLDQQGTQGYGQSLWISGSSLRSRDVSSSKYRRYVL